MTPRANGTAVHALLDLAVFLLTILILIGFLAIAMVLQPQRRKRHPDDPPEHVEERPPLRWQEFVLWLTPPFLIGAGVIVALAKTIGSGSGNVPPPLPAGHALATIPAPPAPVTAPVAASLPSGPSWWSALAAPIVLAIIMLILFIQARRFRSPAPPRLPRTTVRDMLDDSIALLEQEPDPRRAVIAAYANMERAFTRRGVSRRPWEAPFEYLARALQLSRPSEPDLHRLTELFEQARFSHHDIRLDAKREAIRLLQAIRAVLEQVREEALGGPGSP